MLNLTLDYKEMVQGLKEKLGGIVLEEELVDKAKLAVEINRLKKERNAIILGHNYMDPVLYYSICDIVGDSLELSRASAKADKDIIVFCGVKFMAETAKILNPTRTVLLPAPVVGCSLADSITGEDVRRMKALFPGVPVVTYINTYADVKAESDICCTSGNGVKVVQSLNTDKVIFIPDEYLAQNVAKETGKHVIFPVFSTDHHAFKELDYQLIGWRGRCEVHEKFTIEDISAIRQQYPGVVILAHPECSVPVTSASDFTGSTSAMIKFIAKSEAPYFLLLTECSMGENIAAANPDKKILHLCNIRCPHMNKITLEGVLDSLLNTRYIVEVPEDIRLRALGAVERMLAIG